MGADKLWLDVGGRPLVAWTLDAISQARRFDTVCVVAPPERWDDLRDAATAAGIDDLRLVEGGEHRRDSVRAGLIAVPGAAHVLVHDAARPLCPPDVFHRVLDAAREHVTADGRVVRTLDRAELVAVQTPQGFRADILAAAHRRALAEDVRADDDCALVERMGVAVHVVEGDPANLKVTRPADLDAVRAAIGTPA
jgi:2-C-methyl-D-erythritol 4-phosphate cytidylyltransferase